MKVPHRVTGRTSTPNQPANYLQAADMTGLGRGVAEGLNFAGQAADSYEQKQDRFQRFENLSGLSNFETNMAQRLTELKRNQEVDVANFPQTAAGVFDNERERFLAQVPAELQPEFRARTNQIRQRIMGDAMSFQLEAQDAFYTQTITEELSNARLTIEQSDDPVAEMGAQQQHLAEMIMASDLPEMEKARIAREANIALQGQVYKQKVRDTQVSNAIVGPNAATAPLAASIIRQEEGFEIEAYSDKRASTGKHDAWRVGYGSDTVTHPDGRVERVTPQTRVTQEMAERDLERRLGEFEATAAREVGVERWASLPANVRGPLVSVAYNYGSLPSSVERAVATGDPMQIATAVENLSSNKERRKREAAIIRGESNPEVEALDNDQRFADIPYETRLSLRADGQREAESLLADLQAQEKEQYDQQFNDLLNGIADGRMGQADIDQAYGGGGGWLTDFDDRMKAENALANRDGEVQILREAQTKMANDAAIWDPTSTEDKAMQNALFNSRGPEALASHDQNYVRGLAAMAARTNDIPTDAVGMLTGMSRANDPTRANFAYNSLALLQDQAPEAFEHRVTDDVASRVRYWRERKDTMPEEELHQALKGGMSAGERQQRLVLRQEAQDLLNQKVDKIPQAEGLVSEFINRFDPWGPTGAPQLYGIPWAAKGLEREFRAAFVDEYEQYGNLDEAREAAFERLGRSWGVTNIGGQRTLMKYPPQKVGYKAYGGGYDWINNEVRETLGLQDEQFQIISDEQTDQEFDEWRRNPDAPPPSYMIAVKGDKGWGLRTQERESEIGGASTVPLRMNFQPSELEMQFEELEFERAHLEERRDKLVERYSAARQGPSGQGAVMQEYQDELREVERQLEELDKRTSAGPDIRDRRRNEEERLRQQRN